MSEDRDYWEHHYGKLTDSRGKFVAGALWVVFMLVIFWSLQ